MLSAHFFLNLKSRGVEYCHASQSFEHPIFSATASDSPDRFLSAVNTGTWIATAVLLCTFKEEQPEAFDISGNIPVEVPSKISNSESKSVLWGSMRIDLRSSSRNR